MTDTGHIQRRVDLHRLFPQRQIYIRCVGKVQFITFTPAFQAVLAGIAMVFLIWVTYATVLVVFKDRSVAALDDRYRLTQAAYQRRLINLQDAYVNLTSSFGQAKRQFDFASQDVTTKQGLILALLSRENDEEISFGSSATGLPLSPPYRSSEIEPIYELSQDMQRSLYHGDARGVANYGADRIRAAFVWPIDFRSIRVPPLAFATIGSLFSRERTPDAQVEVPHNPALLALERQLTRLQMISKAEVGLLANTQTTFERREDILRGLIRRSRIEPDQYLRRLGQARPMGGPEIPIDQIRIAGTADADFTNAYLRTSAVLDHLSGVFEAMKHFPLAMPVAGSELEPTSGFGPRLDPFTGQSAFHPGLDFGGPTGMPVFAAASGRVVFAGDRGSYGNVVEIDHGMGFHTRYAHLSAIAVRPNSFVARGALVGRVGSTGRSTGPHLHYEVWYDDIVRDPAPFIVAGRSTAEAGVVQKGPK